MLSGWQHNFTYPTKMATRARQQRLAQQPEDPLAALIEPEFYDLVIAEDTQGLIDFLDEVVHDIPPQTLNRWFQKAARLPGNWVRERDENGIMRTVADRNAWLNQFYLKYVPDDIREEELTNRRRFQRSITHQQRLEERARLAEFLGLPINENL